MKNPFSTHVVTATIQRTFNFLSYLISSSQISTSLRYDRLVLNMKEQRHGALDHLLRLTRRVRPSENSAAGLTPRCCSSYRCLPLTGDHSLWSRLLPRVLSSCRWRSLKRGVLWDVLFRWKRHSTYKLGRPNPNLYFHSQVILCFILRDTD